jgi:hypothetical protein
MKKNLKKEKTLVGIVSKGFAYTNNLNNTYRDFAKVESKRVFFRKEIK